MPETPYTEYRSFTFNGPNDSADYNARIEENYKDLIVLYNRASQMDEKFSSMFGSVIKDMMGISKKLDTLEDIVETYADPFGVVSLKGTQYKVDNERFNGTAYAIPEIDRLSDSNFYPGLFLPPSGGSSPFHSAITFREGGFVPGSVQTHVQGNSGSADSVGSIINTSRPELAFGLRSGPNWERSVIRNSTHPDGAIMDLYVSIPVGISPHKHINYINLAPFPIYSVDILGVSYSTQVDVTLTDSDGYKPVNSTGIYSGDNNAIGLLPPGGWSGDADNLAGHRTWVFQPVEATAIRIRFRQRNPYNEDSKYVYTYGANHIDVGYLKTLDQGRAMIRLDASAGTTISDIVNVVPRIYNMSAAYLSEVFSYRVIWETATNSGVYTLTPVPLSTRVWIEVTLKRNGIGTIPMLSSMDIISN